MSVSVCLSVRTHILGTTRPIFIKFTPLITCGSLLFCRRCDTLCTSAFVDDVMLAYAMSHDSQVTHQVKHQIGGGV